MNPNLLPCPDCGANVSKKAASCPQCGSPLHSTFAEPVRVTKPVSTTPSGSGLIAAGYICGGLSLICLPPGLGTAGLVIGIVNITKGHTGHGIAQIIISVTCGFLGMVIGAVMWSL